jgi:hypothetical protein
MGKGSNLSFEEAKIIVSEPSRERLRKINSSLADTLRGAANKLAGKEDNGVARILFVGEVNGVLNSRNFDNGLRTSLASAVREILKEHKK